MVDAGVPIEAEKWSCMASGLLISMATGWDRIREAGEPGLRASRKRARDTAIGLRSPVTHREEPKKTAEREKVREPRGLRLTRTIL